MQHPLTGGTCVALPNVDMCPQLSCALTFMYLQQVSEHAQARADVSLRACGIQCKYAKRGLWQAVLSIHLNEGISMLLVSILLYY